MAAGEDDDEGKFSPKLTPSGGRPKLLGRASPVSSSAKEALARSETGHSAGSGALPLSALLDPASPVVDLECNRLTESIAWLYDAVQALEQRDLILGAQLGRLEGSLQGTIQRWVTDGEALESPKAIAAASNSVVRDAAMDCPDEQPSPASPVAENSAAVRATVEQLDLEQRVSQIEIKVTRAVRQQDQKRVAEGRMLSMQVDGLKSDLDRRPTANDFESLKVDVAERLQRLEGKIREDVGLLGSMLHQDGAADRRRLISHFEAFQNRAAAQMEVVESQLKAHMGQWDGEIKQLKASVGSCAFDDTYAATADTSSLGAATPSGEQRQQAGDPRVGRLDAIEARLGTIEGSLSTALGSTLPPPGARKRRDAKDKTKTTVLDESTCEAGCFDEVASEGDELLPLTNQSDTGLQANTAQGQHGSEDGASDSVDLDGGAEFSGIVRPSSTGPVASRGFDSDQCGGVERSGTPVAIADLQQAHVEMRSQLEDMQCRLRELEGSDYDDDCGSADPRWNDGEAPQGDAFGAADEADPEAVVRDAEGGTGGAEGGADVAIARPSDRSSPSRASSRGKQQRAASPAEAHAGRGGVGSRGKGPGRPPADDGWKTTMEERLAEVVALQEKQAKDLVTLERQEIQGKRSQADTVSKVRKSVELLAKFVVGSPPGGGDKEEGGGTLVTTTDPLLWLERNRQVAKTSGIEPRLRQLEHGSGRGATVADRLQKMESTVQVLDIEYLRGVRDDLENFKHEQEDFRVDLHREVSEAKVSIGCLEACVPKETRKAVQLFKRAAGAGEEARPMTPVTMQLEGKILTMQDQVETRLKAAELAVAGQCDRVTKIVKELERKQEHFSDELLGVNKKLALTSLRASQEPKVQVSEVDVHWTVARDISMATTEVVRK